MKSYVRSRWSFILTVLGIALPLLTLAAGRARAKSSGGGNAPLGLSASNETPFDLNLPGGLTICHGNFALCAASTCTATGGTITDNFGKSFPEASCLCPILHGPALADVRAGNMEGSCAPPKKGGVWSLFWPRLKIPQQTANGIWKKLPAIPQNCPNPNGDAQLVNCFSFSCVKLGKMNGVEIAQCSCPIQSAPGESFAIQAGQCDQNVCGDLPVGAPFTVPNLCQGQ